MIGGAVENAVLRQDKDPAQLDISGFCAANPHVALPDHVSVASEAEVGMDEGRGGGWGAGGGYR